MTWRRYPAGYSMDPNLDTPGGILQVAAGRSAALAWNTMGGMLVFADNQALHVVATDAKQRITVALASLATSEGGN